MLSRIFTIWLTATVLRRCMSRSASESRGIGTADEIRAF
jgi:hypothetical protein